MPKSFVHRDSGALAASIRRQGARPGDVLDFRGLKEHESDALYRSVGKAGAAAQLKLVSMTSRGGRYAYSLRAVRSNGSNPVKARTVRVVVTTDEGYRYTTTVSALRKQARDDGDFGAEEIADAVASGVKSGTVGGGAGGSATFRVVGTKKNPGRYWIQDALKRHKKGALHRQLGIPVGRKIPIRTLQAASKAPGLVGKRARLALTLRKFRKK